MTPDAVIRAFVQLVLGPWQRLWRRLGTRARRLAKVGVLTPLVLVLTGSVAYADGSSEPSALGWIDFKDSHDVSIWEYEMSLDRGGITDPGKLIWSFFIDLGWEIYRGAIAISCWLIDWTLAFEWLGWITGPAEDLGDSLQVIVDRFGATNTLLTITACAAVCWMMRGRWVLGIFELFMSLIIASLAVGALSNPVDVVAGDDGLLIESRDTGLAVASGLNNNGDTTGDPDALREDVVGMIIDTFLRRPQQMINFGRMIDGTDCEDDYQEALKDGPHGTDEDLRDAVGDCDDDAGETAENPNSAMFMSTAIIIPAGGIVVVFAAVLCLVVLIAGVYALYQALKMIIALVLAMLPGNSRGALWMTFADLIISMVTIIFSVIFLAAYLLMVQSLFDNGENKMKTFFIIDLMMLVGILVFWKGRKRLKAAADRLAQAMAKRPGGGGPTSLPGKVRFNATDAYYRGRMAVAGAQAARGAAATLHRGYKTASGQAADKAGAAARAAGSPVSNAFAQIKFASTVAASQHEGAADRLNDRMAAREHGSRKGQWAKIAGTAALAAATGGTSAAAGAATKTAGRQAAITAARRVALQSKLHPCSSTGPTPSGPGGPSGPETRRPGRSSGPRIQPTTATAPTVVQGEVVASRDDAADRLRARLAASRAIPMPGPKPPTGQ